MSWDIRLAEKPPEADEARLNAFVLDSPAGHLYQYPFLERLEDGPPVRRICAWAERGGVVGASAVARLRRLRGIGPWSARVDRGPVVGDLAAAGPLLEALCARLREEGAISVRVSPMRRLDDDGGLGASLRAAGFAPVPDDDYDVTLEMDIALEPEALLASISQHNRRSIRRALKEGVASDRNVGEAELAALEALYASMVTRKGATPRPPGFFHAIAEFLGADPSRGFLQVARYKDEVVGAIVVTRHGPRAIYAFGASKDADDGIPKTHLLHYEAMIAARSLGCSVYDLGGFSAGVGEEGSRTAAQSNNLFKSRFTKNEVAFMPCHERVLRPVLHRLTEGVRRLTGASAPGAGKAAP